MRIEGQRRQGTFLRRLNRFVVQVKQGERVVRAHLANSGRLTELLVRGRRALMVERPSPTRKTRYDLVLVKYLGVWVSVDARKPGLLLAEAVDATKLPLSRVHARAAREELVHGRPEGQAESGGATKLPEFAGYHLCRTEPPVPQNPRGRFDLLLEGPLGPCYVETKSVTLIQDGRALFPDARTERGARHMRELAELAEAGTDTAVVFVVQRADVVEFAPHWQSDPHFGWELVAARKSGVRVLAYRCKVTPYEVTILGSVPVVLT